MSAPYSLLSQSEPTDAELKMLMASVLKEVKEKATLRDEKYKKLQLQLINEAMGNRKMMRDAK